jgi:hypothetical protein
METRGRSSDSAAGAASAELSRSILYGPVAAITAKASRMTIHTNRLDAISNAPAKRVAAR